MACYQVGQRIQQIGLAVTNNSQCSAGRTTGYAGYKGAVQGLYECFIGKYIVGVMPGYIEQDPVVIIRRVIGRDQEAECTAAGNNGIYTRKNGSMERGSPPQAVGFRSGPSQPPPGSVRKRWFRKPVWRFRELFRYGTGRQDDAGRVGRHFFLCAVNTNGNRKRPNNKTRM